MLGQRVTHKVFGEGKITSVEGDYVIIKFADTEKRFKYPEAFKSFLVANNDQTMENIETEIKVKEEKELREKKELKLKRAEEDRLHAELLVNKQDSKKRAAKIREKLNIAFKCTFCDGGKSENNIGFNGICSDFMIFHNIEVEKHVWCSSAACPCYHYQKREITREELEQYMTDGRNDKFICYESGMLRNFKASAGIVQTGKNKGKPMRLLKVQPNSLAVLTTKEPRMDDDARYVFAVFLVDKAFEGDQDKEGYVTANSEYKIVLTPEEAPLVKFWNYYLNPKAPSTIKFGSGLHRYLDAIQGAQILRDIMEIKKEKPDAELANRFFDYFCKINNLNKSTIPAPSGAFNQPIEAI